MGYPYWGHFSCWVLIRHRRWCWRCLAIALVKTENLEEISRNVDSISVWWWSLVKIFSTCDSRCGGEWSVLCTGRWSGMMWCSLLIRKKNKTCSQGVEWIGCIAPMFSCKEPSTIVGIFLSNERCSIGRGKGQSLFVWKKKKKTAFLDWARGQASRPTLAIKLRDRLSWERSRLAVIRARGNTSGDPYLAGVHLPFDDLV